MIAVGKTDIGKKRSCNEDAFFVSTEGYGPLPNIYIVADGMGGHKAGYYASHSAIEHLDQFIKDHEEVRLKTEDDITLLLKRAVSHVNYQLFQKSSSDLAYEGMGTTLTMATIISDRLYVAHVGDSRLYTVSHNGIHQVTRDHSLVQEMVAKGLSSHEEAKKHPKRHVITRAVGTYEKVQVDTYSWDLEGVDYILICSDGITTMLSDLEIQTIIIGKDNLEDKVSKLISAANDAGGNDNSTVVLAIYNKVVKMC